VKSFDPSFCELAEGDGPLVATALHNGSSLRAEVAARIALSAPDRLREEDPHTGVWTSLAPTRVVALRSRFEVDLNRPRGKCVYRRPEDAWGLQVWTEEPPPILFARSLESYDAFYARIEMLYRGLAKRFGNFVVFDLHSYNHRRDGPGSPPSDPAGNPEVNVGTGTMRDRSRWAPLIDRFIADLSSFGFLGRHLDVRENVRFFGGNLGRWTHENLPEAACVLSIEVKKFFMDEWSGDLDIEQHAEIGRALAATVPGVMEELGSLGAEL
jgi:N-formylglutamate amidohydrolase